MDNGPVDFTKEPGNQGLTKKSKLDQDTRYNWSSAMIISLQM